MTGRTASRPSGLTLVTLAIALLSLATAVYQGWVQTRNLEIVQRDLARREQVRSCKEVIEAYFEAKLRIGLLVGSRAAPSTALAVPPEEAAAIAVSRFAALGTYLANFQGEATRQRYTALSRELERLVAAAQADTAPDRSFGTADGLFYEMNEDCVRSTRLIPNG